jgi:archaemetzincin
MKHLNFLIIPILATTFLPSCRNERQHESTLFEMVKPIIPRPVDIYPYGSFSADLVREWRQKLAAMNPEVVLKPAVALPQFAYFHPRKRYMAPELLKHLKSLNSKGRLALGLTNWDICYVKPESPCYGIMGLSHLNGNEAVISTHRLNQKHLAEQGFKLCLHELGHAEGLPHCSDPDCLMKDAGGRNIFAKVNHFCESCAGHLNKKGWKILP